MSRLRDFEIMTQSEIFINEGPSMDKPDELVLELENNVCQWSIGSNGTFVPAAKSVKKLTPGVYSMEDNPQIGPYFRRLVVSTSDLINFEDSVSHEIITDIKKFWTLREKYKQLGQRYSRGHLLHGGAGGGKTSILNLVSQDLIKLGGVVFKFDNPYIFTKCMQNFKKIEPGRNIVVLMEDIEAIINEYGESEILNVLDGVNSVENIVFLATTNYPDKLLGRVTNRPSRFDRVFELKNPNDRVKKLYLETLIGKHKVELNIDLEKWTRESKDLSMAHLKELFLSVALYDQDYEKTLKTLLGMKKNLKSAEDQEVGRMGFGD